MTHRPRPARRRTRRSAPPARAGFTLVELVVAILMLAVGLLSLAGLALTTARLTRGGGTQTVAATLAQARFDSLASVPCRPIADAGKVSGAPKKFRGIRERWVVTDDNDRLNLIDSLWVPGRTAPLVFRSVLPCRD